MFLQDDATDGMQTPAAGGDATEATETPATPAEGTDEAAGM